MTKQSISYRPDLGYYGRIMLEVGTKECPAQCWRYVTYTAELLYYMSYTRTREQMEMLLSQAPKSFEPPLEEIAAVRDFEEEMARRREIVRR